MPEPRPFPRRESVGLRLLLALAAALALAAFPAETGALTPEERGLAIAVEADRRDTGFGDSRAEQTMILRNRHGEESVRELHTQTLERAGDGDRTIVVFDLPRDIDGTALLTYTHKTGDDDQWLYLPELKRVKRISGANRSGSFVGSEFAYEDMTSQEVEKYTYRHLGEEALDGLDCFVVERFPVDKTSGYTREVVWMDKAEYRVHKVHYYDRKGSLLKTLSMIGYRRYLGRYWRPDEMRVVNHQTGKGTTLLWRDYEFRVGLTEADFTTSALRRAR